MCSHAGSYFKALLWYFVAEVSLTPSGHHYQALREVIWFWGGVHLGTCDSGLLHCFRVPFGTFGMELTFLN